MTKEVSIPSFTSTNKIDYQSIINANNSADTKQMIEAKLLLLNNSSNTESQDKAKIKGKNFIEYYTNDNEGAVLDNEIAWNEDWSDTAIATLTESIENGIEINEQSIKISNTKTMQADKINNNSSMGDTKRPKKFLWLSFSTKLVNLEKKGIADLKLLAFNQKSNKTKLSCEFCLFARLLSL